VTRDAVAYDWRGEFTNEALNVLHAEGFEHPYLDIDWHTQLNGHSLGWVCARDGGYGGEAGARGELVGFVNVAWDGGVHAFILDTMVAAQAQRRGIGSGLIATAVEHARAAGCEWLHVDFENHLTTFYFEACGFTPTNAGLIPLRGPQVS
jgi:GNAT superfamily N-acetyltransferase